VSAPAIVAPVDAKVLATPTVAHVITASRRAAFHPKHRILGVLAWPLWPLLDQHTGRPSGPKCMAWALYIAAATGHPVAAASSALLLATMFGYSMFKDAMAKASLNLTSSDSVKVSLAETKSITQSIVEKIDARLGRGPAGEPLRSMPAVPDAKTPSGDD
jgi:hypothetical protein